MGKTTRGAVLIFTALGGLGGLACVLEWLGIKPGDLRMTTTIPHMLWLVFGLVLFSVSISLSVLSWRGSRKSVAEVVAEEKVEVQRLQAALYESARDNLEYRGERDHCDEERRTALENLEEARSQVAIFTPLQLTALTVAKQLGELLREVEPLKIISDADYPDTHEGQTQKILDRLNRVEEYNSRFVKVADRYAWEFAPRVKDVVLLFGQEGLNEPELRQFIEAVMTQDDLLRVRARLVCLAFQQEGIQLSMRKPGDF